MLIARMLTAASRVLAMSPLRVTFPVLRTTLHLATTRQTMAIMAVVTTEAGRTTQPAISFFQQWRRLRLVPVWERLSQVAREPESERLLEEAAVRWCIYSIAAVAVIS